MSFPIRMFNHSTTNKGRYRFDARPPNLSPAAETSGACEFMLLSYFKSLRNRSHKDAVVRTQPTSRRAGVFPVFGRRRHGNKHGQTATCGAIYRITRIFGSAGQGQGGASVRQYYSPREMFTPITYVFLRPVSEDFEPVCTRPFREQRTRRFLFIFSLEKRGARGQGGGLLFFDRGVDRCSRYTLQWKRHMFLW
ncbi:hypothetical protein EVAR_103496_1 [Eumeta japonica]|uniref:Uncharacterized protein n=1 Tax=Eumeta variegata TaxID=151549 RepID=A0A4C1ZL83_EUMVA|nr:hypothetical protein EVAR_103496_1 [Eumeta japonica]